MFLGNAFDCLPVVYAEQTSNMCCNFTQKYRIGFEIKSYNI
jgi:hypothetical protein